MAIQITSPAPNDTFPAGTQTIPASGTTTAGYRKVAAFCHEGPLDPGTVLTMVDNGQIQAAVVDVNQDNTWSANAPGVGPTDNVLRVVGIDENNNTLWIASVEFMVEEPGGGRDPA
jgi:hypothetical protein